MSKKNKKEHRKGKPAHNRQSLSKLIDGIFAQNPTKTLNYKQISSELGIKDMGTKQLVVGILCDMVDLEVLSEISTGKYKLKSIREQVLVLAFKEPFSWLMNC